MRIIAIIATLALMPAGPASADLVSHQVLKPGEMLTETQFTSEQDYDYALRCEVPAFSLGVVTLAKVTPGPSRVDLQIVDKVWGDDDDAHHLRTEGIIAASEGGGQFPQVLVLPVSSERRAPVVAFLGKDENPASYRLYCDNVNPAEVLFLSALRAAWVALQGSNPDIKTSDNVNRGINAALSVIQRDNVLAIGLDAAREEAMIQLTKEYPDNDVLLTFFGAVIDNTLQDVYKHALWEMSPEHLRR
jgi:hypothetical protein